MIFAISGIIFLLFHFGIINPFAGNEMLQEATGYYFVLSCNSLDYLAISSIPIFGMLLNYKRRVFTIEHLIKDIFIILLSATIIIVIGLYLLTFLGKPKNPLIPQFLITEPFFYYSTVIIIIGIGFPFLVVNKRERID